MARSLNKLHEKKCTILDTQWHTWNGISDTIHDVHSIPENALGSSITMSRDKVSRELSNIMF